nr:hypothetical protein [Streptomyces sp. DR3-1]
MEHWLRLLRQMGRQGPARPAQRDALTHSKAHLGMKHRAKAPSQP